MAKHGAKKSIIDMQMGILNGFDRTLRNALNSGEAQKRGITETSGLLRNASVEKWNTVPGMKRLTAQEKRIADLKRQIAE